jgi:hypothetical protein
MGGETGVRRMIVLGGPWLLLGVRIKGLEPNSEGVIWEDVLSNFQHLFEHRRGTHRFRWDDASEMAPFALPAQRGLISASCESTKNLTCSVSPDH